MKTKKHLFTLFFILLLAVGTNAQTLYFKCTTATSGQYNWNTASNWYTDAACTIPAGGVPISTNDVIIDNAAFTANSQTINIDATSQACKGFTVSYAGTYTNVAINSAPGRLLRVFGHFDLTPFDNSKLSIVNWRGDLELNPAGTGTLNVLTGTKRLLLNTINIPGSTIQYAVNFNDSLFLDRTASNGGVINIGSGYTTTNSVRVNFNELLKMGSVNASTTGGNSHTSINIFSGVVNFNNGIFSTITNTALQTSLFSLISNINQGGLLIANSASVTLSPQTFTNVSYPVARNKSVIGLLEVQGTSAVNAPTLSVVDQSLQINGIFYSGWQGGSGFSNINFTNSSISINMRGFRNGYSGGAEITNNTTLTTTGSTINIQPDILSDSQVGNVSFANHNFNVVNFFQHCYTSYSGGFQTYNQLNFVNQNKTFHAYSASPTFSINPGGSVFIAPGTELQSFFGTIRFAPTSSITMQGTCGQSISLTACTFSFGAMPVTNINADRLILHSCTAVGTGTLYAAGANSRFIYGTINTGWNTNCPPSARTLFWQGPIIGGNWSDPNNWSLNPLASPSSTQAPITVGACEPTESDSVVFPPLSNVFVNKMRIYSNSVNFTGTSTITATNGPVTISSGGPLRNWHIYGGWHATNKMLNSLNVVINFNTYKNFRCVKTGGVRFVNDVNFNASHPLNASCTQNTSVTPGGYLILDTLFSDRTINIYRGHFRTYDSNPIFSSFYPSSQKKRQYNVCI